MHNLKRLFDGTNKIISATMATFLLVSVLVIGLQVFTRYVLNYTPPWSEELARYLNVWITMIGVGVVLRRNEHIKLDYLETVLAEKRMMKAKRIINVISLGITAIFFVILAYGGVKILKAASRQLAPGLNISMLIIYIAIPIGCVIALLFLAEKLINYVQQRREVSK